jgi:hypothetical protein
MEFAGTSEGAKKGWENRDMHGMRQHPDGNTYFTKDDRGGSRWTGEGKDYEPAQYVVMKPFAAQVKVGWQPTGDYVGGFGRGHSQVSTAKLGVVTAEKGDSIYHTSSGETFLIKKDANGPVSYTMLGNSTGRSLFERGPAFENPKAPTDSIKAVPVERNPQFGRFVER